MNDHEPVNKNALITLKDVLESTVGTHPSQKKKRKITRVENKIKYNNNGTDSDGLNTTYPHLPYFWKRQND